MSVTHLFWHMLRGSKKTIQTQGFSEPNCITHNMNNPDKDGMVGVRGKGWRERERESERKKEKERGLPGKRERKRESKGGRV